jgi:hypothetical protein
VSGRRIAPGRAVQCQRPAGHPHAVAVTLIAGAFSMIGGNVTRAAEASGLPSADISSGEAKPQLQTITIEARRQLERQVSHFVASVVVHYSQDSLVRWNIKICPLVAGQPREQGEFMLTGISQIARAAGATTSRWRG